LELPKLKQAMAIGFVLTAALVLTACSFGVDGDFESSPPTLEGVQALHDTECNWSMDGKNRKQVGPWFLMSCAEDNTPVETYFQIIESSNQREKAKSSFDFSFYDDEFGSCAVRDQMKKDGKKVREIQYALANSYHGESVVAQAVVDEFGGEVWTISEICDKKPNPYG
jgi:hypothetical protein